MLNETAARRVEEGLHETLTLQRLGVHEALRRSVNTTNLIERVMAQLDRKMQRVYAGLRPRFYSSSRIFGARAASNT